MELNRYLTTTAIIWTFSLTFRTIDMQVCDYTHQLGTHFMWHILNAVVLYRLVELIILNKIQQQEAAEKS